MNKRDGNFRLKEEKATYVEYKKCKIIYLKLIL